MANTLMMRYAQEAGNRAEGNRGEMRNEMRNEMRGREGRMEMYGRYMPEDDEEMEMYGGGESEMRRGRSQRTGRYVRRSNRRMEGEGGAEMSAYGGNEPRRYAGYERKSHYRDAPVEYYTRNAEDYKRPEAVYGGFWMDSEHEEQKVERGRDQRMEDDDEGRRSQSMDKEMAMEWVEGMKGSDPTHPHGPRWKPDEVKLFAQKAGFPAEGNKFYEFWAVMNAMYSDYYEVGKKYGVNNPEFYADLAKSFLNDKDAVKNKAQIYFDCIAKHD